MATITLREGMEERAIHTAGEGDWLKHTERQ